MEQLVVLDLLLIPLQQVVTIMILLVLLVAMATAGSSSGSGNSAISANGSLSGVE